MTTIAQARATLVTAVGAVDAEGTASACYVYSEGSSMERLGQTGVQWSFRVTCAVGQRGVASTGSADLAALVASKLLILNELAGWGIAGVSGDRVRTIGGGEQLTADIAVFTKVDIETEIADSGYADVVIADAPIAYFRLGERPGSAMVDAMGTHNGVYVGSPTLGSGGALTGDTDTAVTFDGGITQWGVVADWDTVPNKPVSLECWVQADDFPTDASIGGWLHQSGVMALQFYASGDGSSIINLRIGTENGNANAEALTSLVFGQWLHLVGTIDAGGSARLYFNGVLVAGPSAVTFTGGASDNPFKVGSAGADGELDSWPGTVDEWAVYDYALSAAQVLAHYQAGT